MLDIDIIRSYYEPKIKHLKEDYQILGWEDKEAHIKRFEVLTNNIDLNGKTILDVGCGLGNLFQFLKQKRIDVDYTGVDILEKMIERAKLKNPGAKYICEDIFKNCIFDNNSFDIVYASGIFNLKLSDNMTFLKNALETFFMLSKNTVVFNLLSTNSSDKEDKYCYYNILDVNRILEGLSYSPSSVKFIDNYLNDDFTVICKK